MALTQSCIVYGDHMGWRLVCWLSTVVLGVVCNTDQSCVQRSLFRYMHYYRGI